MGTRFNVLMNIQVPLEQAPPPKRSFNPDKKKKSGGFFSGFSLGAKKSKGMALDLDMDDCEEVCEAGMPYGSLDLGVDGCEDSSDGDDDWAMCNSLGASSRCRSMRRSSPAPKVGSA